MRIKWNTGNPPNEVEEYLVTTAGGNLYVAEWTNVDLFGGAESRNWVSDSMFLKVVAWMPLPEPYKGVVMKIRTEQVNNFHRHRGNRRKQDWSKAHHKLLLTRSWTSGYDDSDLGRLRKGKIHCSCWLCRSKTNRRKVWHVGGRHGNNRPVNDVRKIESLEDQVSQFKNEE